MRLHAGRLPSLAVTTAGRLGLGLDTFVGPLDVVHWTDYVALPPGRAAVVATVHDVLFETLPACYTPAMRHGLRSVTRRVVREARAILVPSRRTRDDLVAFFGARPEQVALVPHGVPSLPAVEPAQGLGDYALAVGTLEPRKNLLRLLEAHARLVADGEALRLVVVGPRGWLDDDVVAALAARRDVIWEGAVGRERLAALLGGARCLAYPSLGEGFGLPVLEAMSLGCPVLVGEDTACADLAGEAGLAVDARDVDAIAHGLRRLAGDDDLAARLGEAGRRRAAEHTWERAARATRAAYARAIA